MRKLIFFLVLSAIVLISGCVQTQTQKTCDQAVQELESLAENSNYCQTDSDCAFSEPSFIATDGAAYRSDYKYSINKENLEEINSKIKNVLETSCKDAPSTFMGPPDYTKCENNKCGAVRETANQQASKTSRCCAQCIYGSEHDVRGFDISIALCLDYKDVNRPEEGSASEKVLSQECVEYFEESNLTVGVCDSWA